MSTTVFSHRRRLLQPDIQKVYNDLLSEELNARHLTTHTPAEQSRAQALGRLYQTAPDDPIVLGRVFEEKRTTHRNTLPCDQSWPSSDNGSSVSSHIDIPKPRKAKAKQRELSITETLQRDDALPGHRFHVSQQKDPYEASFTASTSSSAFNKNTPKMWPSAAQYTSSAHSPLFDSSLASCGDTHSFGSVAHGLTLAQSTFRQSGAKPVSPYISDRACSKSVAFEDSSSMSALQRTLHQCGRLRLVEDQHDEKEEKVISSSIQKQRGKMRNHVEWLRRECGNNSPNREVSVDNIDSISVNQSSVKSKLLTGDSSVRSKKSSSVLSGVSSSEQTTRSLPVFTLENTQNPYRSRALRHQKIKVCRTLPVLPNDKDTMSYKEEFTVRTLSNFNACVQPNLGIHSAPSRKEVTQILEKLTKKQILHYQGRIIGCGSLVRALKDMKHPTPGFQAVLSLHKDFMRMANVNMNPLLLGKQQAFQVIHQNVAWLDTQTITRLLLSFDSTNTGIVRYVRISCTVLCCFEPAMIKLASSLNRTEQWDGYFIPDRTSSKRGKGKNSSNADLLSEKEWNDFRGEVLLIRLLHQFYSECAGFSFDPNQPSAIQGTPWMKLEDVCELFSCCVTNTEDEHKMLTALRPVLHDLSMASSQPSSSISLNSALTIDSMKRSDQLAGGVKSSTVTVDALLDAVLLNPSALREFIRQMRNFRREALPYILGRSFSVDDAISLYST